MGGFAPGIVLAVAALIVFLVAHLVPLQGRVRTIADIAGAVLLVVGAVLLIVEAVG